MLTLYRGRPADCSNRLDKENRVYDLLDRLGIEYYMVDHPPATTMAVCAEIDGVLNATICKNLFLCNRQATQFYLLMIPGSKRFKTKDISAQLGISRLSFADSKAMESLLDISPGSVSITGLMHDTDNRVQLLIDRDILPISDIGFHPSINTSSIRIRTEDLINRLIPALGHDPKYVTLPEYTDTSTEEPV